MDISVYLKQQLSAPSNPFDLNVNTSFVRLCAGTEPRGKRVGGYRNAEGAKTTAAGAAREGPARQAIGWSADVRGRRFSVPC